MTNAEFESFKKFICSFEDGDSFQFHFDYGDEVENFSIFRIGNKMKYHTDRRSHYEDGWEEYWILDNEESAKTLDISLLNYIGSLETCYMRQGWRDIQCKIHF